MVTLCLLIRQIASEGVNTGIEAENALSIQCDAENTGRGQLHEAMNCAKKRTHCAALLSVCHECAAQVGLAVTNRLLSE